jgi:metal-sulfur cluster biosynthetic enzyme
VEELTMNKPVSEEDVHRALAQVRHPAIDCSLIDLGMIKNVSVRENNVALTLTLPFLGIPIKDYLVHSINEAVTKLGVKVEVKITEMNQRERDNFMAMEQKNWKGLM